MRHDVHFEQAIWGLPGTYGQRGVGQLKPLAHTGVSLGVGGAVWAATDEPLAVPAALAFGVLIDIDHAFDYFNWFVRKDPRHLLLIFHAWEYVIAGIAMLFVAWQQPVFIAAVLGYSVHVVADQVANRMHPMGYWISYRIYARFDRARLARDEAKDFTLVAREAIPFAHLVEPLALRAVTLFRRSKG